MVDAGDGTDVFTQVFISEANRVAEFECGNIGAVRRRRGLLLRALGWFGHDGRVRQPPVRARDIVLDSRVGRAQLHDATRRELAMAVIEIHDLGA